MDHFLVLHMIAKKSYHVQSVVNDVLNNHILATRVTELTIYIEHKTFAQILNKECVHVIMLFTIKVLTIIVEPGCRLARSAFEVYTIIFLCVFTCMYMCACINTLLIQIA